MPDSTARVRLVKGWVKLGDGVLELSNPHTVAAMLCKSWFWGHTREDRRRMKRGLAYEYKPAMLAYVEQRFDPKAAALCVVFGIRGDPEALLLRRDLFLNAQVYVIPSEWKEKKASLDPIVVEAMEKANARLKTLIEMGALK